jgi:hypothetical protein
VAKEHHVVPAQRVERRLDHLMKKESNEGFDVLKVTGFDERAEGTSRSSLQSPSP